MKPKIILCLAFVLSGGLVGNFAVAQSSAKPGQWQPFQILPPITNANPLIRCPISVRVPTKLKIERTTNTLSVEIDTNSFESTNITVGTNMITGVESRLYLDRVIAGVVAPRLNGGSLESGRGWGFNSGMDFNIGKTIWHTEHEGIPSPGMKYIVELDLTIFETDVPPQHEWSPYNKNYKILWQQTLKQAVE